MNIGIKGIDFKRLHFESIVAFFCGFFSTMPIVSTPLMGHYISFFTIFLFLEILIMIFRLFSKSARIGYYSKMYILWLCIAVLASFSGMIISFFSPEMMVTISYVPKIATYIFFIMCWGGREGTKKDNEFMCMGLLYGCYVNIIWSIIDAVCFYSIKISLSNLVFADYMSANNLRYIGLPLANGLYRSGGLNYDPAHLGFLCPLVTLYSLKTSKYRLLLLVAGGLVASASTTGIVCSFVALFIWGIHRILLRKNISNRFRINTIVGALFLVIILCVLCVVFKDQLFRIFGKASSLFYERATTTYFNKGSDLGPREKYLLYFPSALVRLGLFSLFGTGFGTSSYGYTHIEYIATALGSKPTDVYDIENTYLAYIMDTGIIGFVIFIACFIKLVSYYWKKSRIEVPILTDAVAYSGICATLLSFMFYHYILFAPQMLITIVAISEMEYNCKMLHNKKNDT